MTGISSIGTAGAPSVQTSGALGRSGAPTTEGILGGFDDVLKQAIGALNAKAASSDQAVTKLATGQDVDIHEITLGTTGHTFNFAVQLRNKALDAYKEIINTPI